MSFASLLYRQLEGQQGEDARITGAVIGIVTNNQDPLKLGRVQVRLPVISEADNSWWAPMVSAGASKNRGWFFIPEVDDEVVVMFEHGDINHPVVVGALWNGKDKPADKNEGGNPRRVIKSRAGSRLIFDDDKGLLIVEDGVGKGRVTLDAKNNKVTIEALDGDVTLQAPKGTVQIVASESTWTATGNIEIKSGAAFGMGTDASGTIEGKSQMTFDAPSTGENSGAKSTQAPTASPQSVADKYGS